MEEERRGELERDSVRLEDVGKELRADAWSPGMLPALLRHIEQCVSSMPEYLRATTCIFPECGSGFHEWQVVKLLQDTCRMRLSQVVLMDARLHGHWRDAWATMAACAGVQLVTLTSYMQLHDWADT